MGKRFQLRVCRRFIETGQKDTRKEKEKEKVFVNRFRFRNIYFSFQKRHGRKFCKDSQKWIRRQIKRQDILVVFYLTVVLLRSSRSVCFFVLLVIWGPPK